MDDETEEFPQQQLIADNEILKRSLVKVSFAAVGVHQQLDSELQKLREVIRSDSSSEEIHQQVEAIAQILMLVDDEMQQKVSFTSDQLLQELAKQLADDFPDFSGKISRVLSKNKKQPFISTFTKLMKTLPALNKKSAGGFFSRLFNKPAAGIPKDSQHELLQRIILTIENMLKQLSFVNHSSTHLKQIKGEVEALSELSEVPQLLQSVCSKICNATAAEHLRFGSFLTNLNAQLDVVQQIISSNTQTQQQNASAGNALDQQVRSHMIELQEKSKTTKNINELQNVVADRVDDMLLNLDTYKHSLDSFVKQNTKQMKQLSTELDNSRSNINQLQQQLQQQQHLAETDQLTNLPNRHAFQQKISEEYNRWRRYRQPLSIAIADIDHFKAVNDNFGHALGDQALKKIAAIFHNELRETDVVARYGGEEFIFIMPETSLTQATKALNKLRQQLATNKLHMDKTDLSITVSMGVAEFTDNDTIKDVIERSDKALYRAKEKGRNQVCCELKELP